MATQTYPQNNITVFRNSGEGFLYYFYKGESHQLNIIQGNVFKIYDKSFTGQLISQVPELQFKEIKTQDGYRTFMFTSVSQAVAVGRTGGGGGIRGINVQDEGIQFSGTFQTLNFAGVSVIVTDDGGGTATVTIGAGGMISGIGTPNRLAMFTAPNTIADSPLLRSGSNVIADGFIYFNSGNGIDVVASGGADILNIGTTNADVINYGYAGTTHNMNGTTFNVITTNLNVTDKIITLNDGGAAGSGGNTGFEIEEAGVATGYFIQNTARTGFDFQASAVTGVATFSLALLTANRTATLQNASGTIAYLSDIPVVTGFFAQGGNSFGATARLGTNDAFALEFETNNTLAGTISSAQLWSIGSVAPVVGTRTYIEGLGTTMATFALRIENDSPTSLNLLSVRDDGLVTVGALASLVNPIFNVTTGAGTNLVTFTSDISSQLKLIGLSNSSYFLTNGFNGTWFEIQGSANNPLLQIATNGMVGIGALVTAPTAMLGVTQTIVTTGSPTAFFVTGAAHTTLTASVESVGARFNFSAIKQFATGALTTQREVLIQAPTYAFVGASTITNAATCAITGAPIAGTNATITNQFALWIQSGSIALSNGQTPVTSPADMIQLFSVDTDDATASLGLRTEQAVVTEAVVSDRTLKITINGTIYKVCLKV